ncbi:MAG: S-methyl-5-thioribose-1-phosphate isomerase [Nitrospirae bacterium]|nr:S-methyl-5-thioribose-1-phosphate isomerase [Nitrospirota bacterium]
MPLPTIEWDKGKVKMIDQTRLPDELVYIYCSEVKSVWEAIKNLRVRGAPALGIAAALGTVVGIQDSQAVDYDNFYKELEEVTGYLATARPTAVNLFWALDRMKAVAEANREQALSRIKELLLKEALNVIEENRKECRDIGRNGAELIKDGDTVLTHCNAGGLATADYGTALALIFTAQEEGKRIKVYADETRPLLQGARLTTWELLQAGIDTTLICDNMAAQVMKEGRVNMVLVGADRIAANGDTANKIGTYGLAVLAEAHNIPFYVAAPTSTFDLSLDNGSQIPIEEREAEEITCSFGKRIAPEGVKVYCPAFDVTPARLITAIVTEKGIARPPYGDSLKK